MYGLYLIKKKKTGSAKKQTFEQYVQAFLSAPVDNNGGQVGLQAGFGFVMVLLREMQGTGALLERSMEHVAETLKRAEPGSFFSNDRTQSSP